MTNTWQLQEAKNKFSEVVRCAERNGPQFITVRGHEAVVVLSVQDYRRREQPESRERRPGESLYDWLKRGGVIRPIGDDLNIERDPNDVVPATTIFDS